MTEVLADDGVLQPTDFLIIVDDLDGTRAYRVESFNVDIQAAILRPVFNNGCTTHSYSQYCSFRLVSPKTEPTWVYTAAKELLETPDGDFSIHQLYRTAT